MKALFVDTAGWMACADAADPAHGRATTARDRWLERKGVLVTTDYVIDETLTLIRFRLGLPGRGSVVETDRGQCPPAMGADHARTR